MTDFMSALASLDAAVRTHILVDIEVSSDGGVYRVVRGSVTQRAEMANLDSFDSRFADVADRVEIDMADFAGLTRPTIDWLVRYRDELGVVRIKAIAEPLTPSDVGPRFLGSTLKDLDPEDPRLP